MSDVDFPEKRRPSGFRGWVHDRLHSRWMPLWMMVLAFLETTILMAPMEAIFIPVMATNRKRIFWLAALLLIGCTLGAVVTYFLAAAVFEPAVVPILEWLDIHQQYQKFSDDVRDRGFVALFIIGITPIPIQVGTVAAGALELSFLIFLAAVLLSRGIRYFGLALLVYVVGAGAEKLIRRYETEIAVGSMALFVALVAGGWVYSRLF